MQIGEFAKVCGTKISILRHYDKAGVLRPDYTDRFTGYRYYAQRQVMDFVRITVLKQAGFSLTEIRDLMDGDVSPETVLAAFERKRELLQKALLQLDEAKQTILGVEQFMKMNIIKSNSGLQCSAYIGSVPKAEDYRKLDRTLSAEGYQRISAFTAEEKTQTLTCTVTKLSEDVSTLHEDLNIPFENDEAVIGKWETVGMYAVAEDFLNGVECLQSAGVETVYFLPKGERYWCFSWTKGKLLIDDEESTSVNPFTLQMIGGKRYMLVSLKSYEYRRGGQPTVLVLRQADNRVYTAEETVRKENTRMPFVPDAAVLGKWCAVDFCTEKSAFDPEKANKREWYFSSVEFKPDGEVVSAYDYGQDVIESKDMQEWTKGYVLRHWNHCACAYEIRTMNEKDYLFMEWKSGDYRWGGQDTDYYVFERT